MRPAVVIHPRRHNIRHRTTEMHLQFNRFEGNLDIRRRPSSPINETVRSLPSRLDEQSWQENPLFPFQNGFHLAVKQCLSSLAGSLLLVGISVVKPIEGGDSVLSRQSLSLAIKLTISPVLCPAGICPSQFQPLKNLFRRHLCNRRIVHLELNSGQ